MTEPPSDPDDETSVDPMLLFAVETDAATPEEPGRSDSDEPESFGENSPRDEAPLPAPRVTADVHALDERVLALEKALEQSAGDIGELRAQLATLVVNVGDISSRLHESRLREPRDHEPPPREPPDREQVEMVAPAATLSPPVSPSRRTGSSATVAGLAIAVALIAVVLWFLQTDASQTPVPAMEPLQAAADLAPGSGVDSADAPAARAEEPVLADEPETTDEDNGAGTDAVSAVTSPPVPERAVSQPREPAVTASSRPVRFVGTLSIASVPADAKVFLNRELVGTGPVRLPELRAGSHLVWVEREGFRRWTRVVLVPANQVTRVSVELESLRRP